MNIRKITSFKCFNICIVNLTINYNIFIDNGLYKQIREYTAE